MMSRHVESAADGQSDEESTGTSVLSPSQSTPSCEGGDRAGHQQIQKAKLRRGKVACIQVSILGRIISASVT